MRLLKKKPEYTGLLPKEVEEAYMEVYGISIHYMDWYYRFISYFLKEGIPEEGVAGIIRKHYFHPAWVSRYGRCENNRPEGIARHVLLSRRRTIGYDSLAKPRIRVTSKVIRDFRERLEKELMRIWTYPMVLEETIKEECYDPSDEEIAKMIRRGIKPEVWANDLNEI